MSDRILLLDLMDTVVREPFRETIPRFFGLSLEELIAQKDPRSWIEFEHGRIDEETYAASFFADRRPVELTAMKAWMIDSYAYLEGVEELLGDLKDRGVPMYALSNYSRWYELMDAKLGLSRFLDLRFISCNTGHRKPSPEAYLTVSRTLGIRPSRCVFVDDRRKNVEAAEALGMVGILRDPADTDHLRRDLTRLALL